MLQNVAAFKEVVVKLRCSRLVSLSQEQIAKEACGTKMKDCVCVRTQGGHLQAKERTPCTSVFLGLASEPWEILLRL